MPTPELQEFLANIQGGHEGAVWFGGHHAELGEPAFRS